jgi:hypothetical protein
VIYATSFRGVVVHYFGSSRGRHRPLLGPVIAIGRTLLDQDTVLCGGYSPPTDQKPITPSGLGKVEVLGNRVRCDNRYQELKIPESEYRAFFDQCIGEHEEGGMKSTKPCA